MSVCLLPPASFIIIRQKKDVGKLRPKENRTSLSENKKRKHKTGELYDKIAVIVEQARHKAATAVNLTMVYAYYEIGRYIVEDEQRGEQRAEYGKNVLKELSGRLTQRFGKGFSVDNLQNMRSFFVLYSEQALKYETLSRKLRITNNRSDAVSRRQSAPSQKKERQKNTIDSAALTQSVPKYQTVSDILQIPKNRSNKTASTVLPKLQFTLSWSHYLVLMRVENPDARRFYEIEAAQQQWSVRQLARQCASSLYERLALSREKKEVMRLANEGQTVEKPQDILKNPVVLEFLGLEEKPIFTETDIENCILDNLQKFMLEMGKGFLFEARQKRFTFDEEHYFLDLVLYNRLLQSYVLIDLKTQKIKHKDLGQMQMYVNYYDRNIKQPYENPTLGILLCENANQTLVELTLPDNANIYAAQYALYLPDKALIQNKLKEWIDEYNSEKADKNE